MYMLGLLEGVRDLGFRKTHKVCSGGVARVKILAIRRPMRRL